MELRKDKPTFYNDIKKTMKMLVSNRMRLFLPQTVWTGASIAFWSGMLTPIMTKQLKNDDPDVAEDVALYKCLYAFVALGCG